MAHKQVVSDSKSVATLSNLNLDYAILVMAIHSAIEVFYPSTLVSSDGLYPWRYYVYAGAITVPTLMAALAFVNPYSGYWAMGTYCMLPIRPFWYRLALTWIPRYIIILIIVGLAIAIYTQVGFEFRKYSTFEESVRRSNMELVPEKLQKTLKSTTKRPQDDHRRASSMAHEILSSNREASFCTMTGQPLRLGQAPPQIPHRSVSLPENVTQISTHLGSSARPMLFPILSSLSETYPSSRAVSPGETNGEQQASSSAPSSPSQAPSISAQAHRQRRFISRQLRLLFIYPLVYTLMWLIPFVQHCTFYQDRWAQYPMYFLRIANVTCITLMGFVDCLVFSMREKPWRSIDNSDGTFWGSLSFRRAYSWPEDGGTEGTDTSDYGGPMSLNRTLTEGPLTGRFRGSVRGNTRSNTSDIGRIAAGQARTRLNMEMDERRARVRRESTVTEGDGDDSPVGDSRKLESQHKV
jgi:G protein-coupled receptor GPR1